MLTIFKYPELCINTVFQTGRGENTRNIPIRECYESIGTKHAEALVGFHVFTGCDQIGRFQGISKSKWWKIFKGATDEELVALKELGEDIQLPGLHVLEGLEKFVSRGYARGNFKSEHLADMRWHLFTKYSVDASKLPPTQAALKYRVF